MEFKAGHYIKSEQLGLEGILLKVENALHFPPVSLFCTRDAVYPSDVGKTIYLNLNPKYWEIDNDRV